MPIIERLKKLLYLLKNLEDDLLENGHLFRIIKSKQEINMISYENDETMEDFEIMNFNDMISNMLEHPETHEILNDDDHEYAIDCVRHGERNVYMTEIRRIQCSLLSHQDVVNSY